MLACLERKLPMRQCVRQDYIFCFLKAATDINKLKQIQDVNQQDRRN